MTSGECFQSSDTNLAKTGQRTWPKCTIVRPLQGGAFRDAWPGKAFPLLSQSRRVCASLSPGSGTPEEYHKC